MGARAISTPSTTIPAVDFQVTKALFQRSPDRVQICAVVGADFIDLASETSTLAMPFALSYGDMLTPASASTRITFHIMAGIRIADNSVVTSQDPFMNFGFGFDLKNGAAIGLGYRQIIIDGPVQPDPVIRAEFSWPLGTVTRK
jgi:hypothetical protein